MSKKSDLRSSPDIDIGATDFGAADFGAADFGATDIGTTLLKDRHRLKSLLRSIQQRRKQGKPADQLEQKLQKQFDHSVAQVQLRLEALPEIQYPAELPVAQRADEIIAAIKKHPVVIVAGETGSGKSTQLPKMCLAAGQGVFGRIAHTQPRRLAARSLASRIAEELQTPLGETVGYKVRFQDTVKPQTLVKLLTDGMLLAELQNQKFLDEYDTIIIDEAHERSLNIDFILGYLKQLQQRRKDLKIIITSATIDLQRFSQHFNDAPIIEVSGRTYDVEVLYRPLPDEDPTGATDGATLDEVFLATVNEIINDPKAASLPSGILTFLPGERDIRHFSNLLRRKGPKQLEVLPLYSRLSSGEQEKIFRPGNQRRIVLATNVAETSITVPQIGYVIDFGTARISRYSVRSKMQRLPIEPVSQASANQRKGRCGRLAAGRCFRLYSEQDFLSRDEFTDPEILRTNLASVILQMANLGLGDIGKFPFIEPPESRQIGDGYKLLEELGAIDAGRNLTEIGTRMARLPTEPRLARMMIEAQRLDCVAEIITIVSGLSIPDPRMRPVDRQSAADQVHAEFRDKQSDFLSLLNLWNSVETQRESLSRRGFNQWLKNQFLSYLRINEWREIHYQLTTMARSMDLVPNKEPAEYAAIHRALLSGLISHVGLKVERRLYQGTRNRKFIPFPGSSLHRGNANWVMAAEIVETEQVYGRTLADIQPQWIEQQAKHLLKYRYFEPHWSKKRACAMAFQEVSLMGLVLNPKQRVNFASIDARQSREIFIYNALVAGDYATQAPFMKHNKQLIADLEDRENRARRRDILIEDTDVYAWFEQRIPDSVVNGHTFEQWRKKAEQQNPQLLYLTEQALTKTHNAEITTHSFPDALDVAGGKLAIDYQFEPGRTRDGLTVEVPLTLLNQVDANKLEWLVPGLEREKCIALLKSLPKLLRKHLVPAPQYADAFLATQPDRTASLYQQFADYLKQHSRVDVRTESWRLDQLPEYLIAKIRVLDHSGKLLEESSDLHGLKRRLQGEAKAVVTHLLADQWDNKRYTTWDFDRIPEEFQHHQEHSGSTSLLIRYPALRDLGDAVCIELFEDRTLADQEMQRGLLRLFLLALPQQIRYLKKHCGLAEKAALMYVPFGDKKSLLDSLVSAAFYQTFVHKQPLIRTEAEFTQRLDSQRAQLVASANSLRTLLTEILTLHHEVEHQISEHPSQARQASYDDIQFQLGQLLPSGWVSHYDLTRLSELPRYLQAIVLRIEKLRGNLERDIQEIPRLQILWDQYTAKLEQHREQGKYCEALAQYRWMLEELRISLFAQGLKTRYPVSYKRLEKQWATVQP